MLKRFAVACGLMLLLGSTRLVGVENQEPPPVCPQDCYCSGNTACVYMGLITRGPGGSTDCDPGGADCMRCYTTVVVS